MRIFCTFFLLLSVFTMAVAQVPQLLKDINPGWEFGVNSAYSKDYAVYNGKLYFTANAGNTTTGYELWETDGTTAGTVMVKDINPGPASSSPINFQVASGYLFFAASGAGTGKELWRSDGTDAGTILVKDIAPGTTSSIINSYNPRYESTIWNDVLYFAANDGTTGIEVWRSDGTADGTYLLKDINPTASGPNNGSFPSYFTEFDGKLYFAAQEPSLGKNLWVTDGTEAGTQLLKDFSTTDFLAGFPSDMVECNGSLLFIADGGSANGGIELYRTNGTTAGTVRVKDIKPGASSALSTSVSAQNELKLVKMGNKVYFSASGPEGKELWSSDGTEQGTQIVFESTATNQTEGASSFGIVGNTLYYRFDDGVHGKELWRTDGTAAGTYMVKDIVQGSGSGLPFITYMIAHNGYVFFNADDGINGEELWKSDGTEGGTSMVADINVGDSSRPHQFSSLGDNLLFVAETDDEGAEYWMMHVDLFVPLQLNVEQAHQISCNGGDDGALSVNVTSGTAPYSYAWTPSSAQGTEPTGLAAGSYTLTITDANGATSSATFELTEPTALSTSTASVAATYTNANGSANVTVTGGTPVYHYLWSNGGTAATINNVTAGEYTVTITDGLGCTSTATVTVAMTTAVDEAFSSSLQVTPTLSKGQFSLRSSQPLTELRIGLLDIQGHVVKEWHKVATEEMLSMDSPVQGLYYLRIMDGERVAVKKMVFVK